MGRLRISAGAAAVAIVLAVTACSSTKTGGSDASASSPASSPSAPAASASSPAVPGPTSASSTTTALSPAGTKGVADGITSAKVCTLLTDAVLRELLGGMAAAAPGTPDTRYGGQATCAWSSAGGLRTVHLTITHNGGVDGCNNQPGENVGAAGWTGCYHPNQGMVGAEGPYYVSVEPDLGTGPSPPDLKAVEATAISQVLEALHA